MKTELVPFSGTSITP
jgi:hypothetical protein